MYVYYRYTCVFVIRRHFCSRVLTAILPLPCCLNILESTTMGIPAKGTRKYKAYLKKQMLRKRSQQLVAGG